MKIASAQIACILGDVAANVRKIRDFALRARKSGADLIVFPEMSDTGYVMSIIREHATTWSEGAVPELQKIAQEISIAIISGVSERQGDCIHNTQIVIDRAGNTAAKYRKTHLFSPAPIEEDRCFTAGTELVSCKIDNFILGLGICYDLRFPEFYRELAVEHHANVLINSSAWPFPRVEHLRVLATARAIENQSYMIIANRVGTDDGVTFCGSSVIIDPYGVVIAAASTDREEIISAEISKEDIDLVRTRMPVFEHRRRDLY
ncbi:MAG: nitrilase-related carbon-nitrogen hydrolase [Spartobacteria bacterium]